MPIPLKSFDWKCFINGVEVRRINFSVTVGMNDIGQASISLRPDSSLMNIRPGSVLSIFLKDEYEDVSDTPDTLMAAQKQYKLFWEGVLQGPSYTKSAGSRQFQFIASGMMSVFNKHKVYLTADSGLMGFPHISGSSLIYPGDSQQEDVGLISVISTLMNTNSDTTFADALLTYSAWLLSYNASARLQAARTQLLCRIAAIKDDSLKKFIRTVVGFQDMTARLSGQESFLQVLMMIMQRGYYGFTSTTGPHLISSDSSPIGLTGVLADAVSNANLYSFKRPYISSEYLILPDMFYTAPPPCNFVFPEHTDNITYSRIWDNEPTRYVMFDPNVSMTDSPGAVMVIPESLMSGITSSGASMYGSQDAPSTASSLTPYAYGDKNLLDTLSLEEVEKGIIIHQGFNDREYFAAVANYTNEDWGGAENITDIVPPGSNDSGDGVNKTYYNIIRDVATHQYEIDRATRTIMVTLRDHRWLVPGFPMVVFDKEFTIFGMCQSVTYTVGLQGSISVQVQMTRTRVLDSAIAADSTKESIDDFNQRQKAREQVAADFIKAYSDLLDNELNGDMSLFGWQQLFRSDFTNFTNTSAYRQFVTDNSISAVDITNALSSYVDDRQSTDKTIEDINNKIRDERALVDKLNNLFAVSAADKTTAEKDRINKLSALRDAWNKAVKDVNDIDEGETVSLRDILFDSTGNERPGITINSYGIVEADNTVDASTKEKIDVINQITWRLEPLAVRKLGVTPENIEDSSLFGSNIPYKTRVYRIKTAAQTYKKKDDLFDKIDESIRSGDLRYVDGTSLAITNKPISDETVAEIAQSRIEDMLDKLKTGKTELDLLRKDGVISARRTALEQEIADATRRGWINADGSVLSSSALTDELDKLHSLYNQLDTVIAAAQKYNVGKEEYEAKQKTYIQTTLESWFAFLKNRYDPANPANTPFAPSTKIEPLNSNDLKTLLMDMGVYTPPNYFNSNLLDPVKMDAAYAALLGTVPGIYNSRQTSIPGNVESTFDFTVATLTALDSLYNILPSTGYFANIDAKYDQPQNKDTDTRFKWIDGTVNRRQLISLYDYCRINGLTAEYDVSNPPDPTYFIKLTTKDIFGAAPFSLISDENDAQIDQLKRKLGGYSIYTTPQRQQIVIDYTKKHFGSGIVDGN